MNLVKITSLLFLLLALTSCFDITERVVLAKDGSGVYSLSFDMSDAMGASMLSQLLQQESTDEAAPQENVPVDTIITLADDPEFANPAWTSRQHALVGKAELRLQINADHDLAMTTLTFPFTDVNELEEFQRLMREAEQADGESGNPLSQGATFSITDFTFRPGRLSQQSMMGSALNTLGADGSEEEGMEEFLAMMLGDSRYRFEIVYPGKVKKVTGYEGHRVDGNRLIVDLDLMDMVRDTNIVRTSQSGEVKFRK